MTANICKLCEVQEVDISENYCPDCCSMIEIKWLTKQAAIYWEHKSYFDKLFKKNK